MELARYKPWVIGEFNDLHESPVWRDSGEVHPGRLKLRLESIRHLKAVAVALVGNLCAVHGCGAGADCQLRRIEAESLRAPLLLNAALIWREVNDRVLGEHVELRGVCIGRGERLASELNHGDL